MSFSLLRRAAVAPTTAARAFSTTSPRSVARITIVGHLADTPEVHTTSTGREIIRYAIASNSGSRENRKTSWFRVASFAEGPTKDFMLNIPKGSMLYVEADASTNSYTAADGQQKTSFNFIQRNVDVLKRPYSGEQQHGESE
ncbi:Fc.00g109900.m01.CDS01 [Cosmosporella sp. VM-42]